MSNKTETPAPENNEFLSRLPDLCQLSDRFGNTFHFGNAGDHWHPPFPIGAERDYRTHVREVRDMEIRDDDILMVSFPKTGTHWHAELISMLRMKSAKYVPEAIIMSGGLDMKPTQMVAEVPGPRFLKTHLPFRYVPKQAFEKNIKIVFLDRNPKDVLVSYYNHMHSHKPPLNYPGTFEQFFHLYLEVGYYYGDIFDYFMGWQEGIAAYPEARIYTSVFEDMKKDPVAGVIKLNEFLETGCSEELCEEIAIACSFKNLKVEKEANMPKMLKGMFKGEKVAFYRKGEIGDWKNWFTVAMNEKFDREFKKRMAGYKRTYTFSIDD